MGREKEYRQRLKYQVSSVGSKSELDEWLNLLKGKPSAKLKESLPSKSTLKRLENENEFKFELRAEYGMAPVKDRAVMQILCEIAETLSENRPSNTVMYWAVASSEPAGKPIEERGILILTV